MFINRIIRTPLFLATMVVLLFTGQARAEGEQQAIEKLNAVLLETMQQGQKLCFSGRLEKLAQPLSDLFDFQTMTRISLQRHWKGIGDADRAAIVRAFARMSIATFASRFDNHSGERFVVEGTKPGPRSLMLVSTLVERPGRENVNLTYVLRDTDTGPQVIDVLAQGKFSELARQRAEMSSVFSKSGTAGLIKALDAKASELAGK